MNFADLCWFRAASTGSGNFVPASAITGYLAPADVLDPPMVDGASYSYVAQSDDESQKAYGYGTWDAGAGTLVRSISEKFIGAGFAGDFTAAPKVMLTPLAVDLGAPVSVTTGASPVTLPFASLILLTSGNTGGVEEFDLPDVSSMALGPAYYQGRSMLVIIVAGYDTATVKGTNWGEEFTSPDSWVRYVWTGTAWDVAGSSQVPFVDSPFDVSFLRRNANGKVEWVKATSMFSGVTAGRWKFLGTNDAGNVGYSNIPINDPSAYEEVVTVPAPTVTTLVGDFNVQRIITSGSNGPEHIAIPDPAIHIEAEYQVIWHIDGSGGGGDVPTFDTSNLKMPNGSTPTSVQFTEYLGPGDTFNSRMMLKSRFTYWEIFAASTGVVTP